MPTQILKLAAAAGAILAAYPAQAAEIVIGVPNWPSANAGANILKTIAERNFGADVTLVPSSNPVIFAAMDAGEGDIDVHPEVWLPSQKSFVDEYVRQAGTVGLTDKMFEGFYGYCMTEQSQELLGGITSVAELVDPAVAEKLDTDGDGQGEIWIGAPGWASTNVEKVKMREYGLEPLYEGTVIGETLAYARIEDMENKGEPYVFWCYGPHHIFSTYDLVVLDEPEYDESEWTMIQPGKDPQWFEKSSVSVGWEPIDIHTAYSRSLEERAPDFVTLLKNYAPTAEMVSDWQYQLVVNEKAPEEFAEDWIADNRDTVDQWLGF